MVYCDLTKEQVYGKDYCQNKLDQTNFEDCKTLAIRAGTAILHGLNEDHTK